jgi:hypothetical protein
MNAASFLVAGELLRIKGSVLDGTELQRHKPETS